MIANFLEMLSGVVFSILTSIVSLLPDDIFTEDNYIMSLWNAIDVDGSGQIARYVSYLVPVSPIAATLTVWVSAMAVFLAIRYVMRFSGK